MVILIFPLIAVGLRAYSGGEGNVKEAGVTRPKIVSCITDRPERRQVGMMRLCVIVVMCVKDAVWNLHGVNM
jgi:hypothetical protein